MNKKTLLEIVNELQASGYTEEIRLHRADLHLYAISRDVVLGANDFTVDKAYRFEGSTSEEDTSELYAISSSKNDFKGILIDEFDEFRGLPDHPLIDKLKEADKSLHLYDDSDQEIKYGVPKVYKSKFNEDPERYELRKHFPDFPSCPYGESFSMLGYDKLENRYVWLVSSIIKDERLSVNEYTTDSQQKINP